MNCLNIRQVFRETEKLHLLSPEECCRWLGCRENPDAIVHLYGREFKDEALTVLSPLIEDARRISEAIGASELMPVKSQFQARVRRAAR